MMTTTLTFNISNQETPEIVISMSQTQYRLILDALHDAQPTYTTGDQQQFTSLVEYLEAGKQMLPGD